MPPGGLFVYAPSTSTKDFANGYEPVMMWKSPAGYLDGFAAASNAPWSAIVLTRSACIVPSFFAATSAGRGRSPRKRAACLFSARSAVHLRGRACTARDADPEPE